VPHASRRRPVSAVPDCRAASGRYIPFETNHGAGSRAPAGARRHHTRPAAGCRQQETITGRAVNHPCIWSATCFGLPRFEGARHSFVQAADTVRLPGRFRHYHSAPKSAIRPTAIGLKKLAVAPGSVSLIQLRSRASPHLVRHEGNACRRLILSLRTGCPLVVAFFVIVILARSIRVANQYERGVVFRLGKYNRTAGPGLISCGRLSSGWSASTCAR
jgi:hypothetical protein